MPGTSKKTDSPTLWIRLAPPGGLAWHLPAAATPAGTSQRQLGRTTTAEPQKSKRFCNYSGLGRGTSYRRLLFCLSLFTPSRGGLVTLFCLNLLTQEDL